MHKDSAYVEKENSMSNLRRRMLAENSAMKTWSYKKVVGPKGIPSSEAKAD